MENVSSKCCEVCLKKGLRNKAKTICDECREFYCTDCSHYHLQFKACKDHHLIDVGHLTEGDVKAIGSSDKTGNRTQGDGACATPDNDVERNAYQIEDIEIVSEVVQFRVKISEDEKTSIRGIVVLSDRVIISDDYRKLHLFDTSGKYLSSVDSSHAAWGITKFSAKRFATCGMDKNVFYGRCMVRMSPRRIWYTE